MFSIPKLHTENKYSLFFYIFENKLKHLNIFEIFRTKNSVENRTLYTIVFISKAKDLWNFFFFLSSKVFRK